MKISNSFTVQASPEDAYRIVTDVKRVAPCFPGARLDKQIDADTFRGDVVIALGPVKVNFAGKLQFTHRDQAALGARLRARGKEQQGRGAADATVSMQLEPEGDATRVVLAPDLHRAGAVAQYGRGAGVLESVAAAVHEEFAENLAKSMAGEPVDAGAQPISGARIVGRAVVDSVKKKIT